MFTWDEITMEIERIIAARKSEYLPATVQSAADFISFARDRLQPPDNIGPGYYPTICLSWSFTKPLPIELEINVDKFELYQFADRKTDIRHFDHIPGQPVPSELAALLSRTVDTSARHLNRHNDKAKEEEVRLEIVKKLVRFDQPIATSLAELSKFHWDYDGEPFVISMEQVISILKRFLANQLSAKDVEDWADAIELRDDISYDDRSSEWIGRAITILSSPPLNDQITIASVQKLLAGYHVENEARDD